MVVQRGLRTSAYIRRDQQLAVLLLLPAATAIFVVMILPLGFALYASLFDYSLGQEGNMTFVFLDNYLRFFSDSSALRALLNTVLLTALSLVVSRSCSGRSIPKRRISCAPSSRCRS
jgi:ABC-type sugar transport system permease subunit